MDQNITVYLKMALDLVKERWYILIKENIMVSGWMIKSMEKEFIHILMEKKNMMEIGNLVKKK